MIRPAHNGDGEFDPRGSDDDVVIETDERERR